MCLINTVVRVPENFQEMKWYLVKVKDIVPIPDTELHMIILNFVRGFDLSSNLKILKNSHSVNLFASTIISNLAFVDGAFLVKIEEVGNSKEVHVIRLEVPIRFDPDELLNGKKD